MALYKDEFYTVEAMWYSVPYTIKELLQYLKGFIYYSKERERERYEGGKEPAIIVNW